MDEQPVFVKLHADYLRRAADADARAATTADLQLRIGWWNIAASWRQMAEQAERMSKLES